MSDTNNRPNADGSLRGDDKNMPDRGTKTGVTDTYGADLSLMAINRIGGISKFTQSDMIDETDNDDGSDRGEAKDSII